MFGLNETVNIKFPDQTCIKAVIMGIGEDGNYKCSAIENNGKYKQGDEFYVNEDTHNITKTSVRKLSVTEINNVGNLEESNVSNTKFDGNQDYALATATAHGGVKGYAVDIDLENGEQLRGSEFEFKDFGDAVEFYNKIKAVGSYKNKSIEDIQLMLVFNDGEFQTVHVPKQRKLSGLKNILSEGLGTAKRGTGRLIKTTYQVVTPESAEEGDFAEQGWENEAGVPVESVEEAIEFLRDEGATEYSSYPFQEHGWYATVDPDRNYQTGGETYKNYHLEGFTPEELKTVYEGVVNQRKFSKLGKLKNTLAEAMKMNWGFDIHKSPWKFNKVTGMIEKDEEAITKLGKKKVAYESGVGDYPPDIYDRGFQTSDKVKVHNATEMVEYFDRNVDTLTLQFIDSNTVEITILDGFEGDMFDAKDYVEHIDYSIHRKSKLSSLKNHLKKAGDEWYPSKPTLDISKHTDRMWQYYLRKAKEAIDNEDEVAFDVALENGQMFGNVKHMDWFIQAVAEELESLDESTKLGKLKKHLVNSLEPALDEELGDKKCLECGGELQILGKLGKVLYTRCKNCGINNRHMINKSNNSGGSAFEDGVNNQYDLGNIKNNLKKAIDEETSATSIVDDMESIYNLLPDNEKERLEGVHQRLKSNLEWIENYLLDAQKDNTEKVVEGHKPSEESWQNRIPEKYRQKIYGNKKHWSKLGKLKGILSHVIPPESQDWSLEMLKSIRIAIMQYEKTDQVDYLKTASGYSKRLSEYFDREIAKHNQGQV